MALHYSIIFFLIFLKFLTYAIGKGHQGDDDKSLDDEDDENTQEKLKLQYRQPPLSSEDWSLGIYLVS